MVPSAERDSELVTYLAAQRAGLGESKMVGVRGFAAAHEARLLGDIAKVLPVAIATWSGDREDALVDAFRQTSVCGVGGKSHLGRSNLRHRRVIVRERSRFG